MSKGSLSVNEKDLARIKSMYQEGRSEAAKQGPAAQKQKYEEDWNDGEFYLRVQEKLKTGEKLTRGEIGYAQKLVRWMKLERRRLLRNNKLTSFCPNGRQEQIIKEFADPQRFIISCFAGNGMGKTALLINILGNIVFGAHPFDCKPGTIEEVLDLSDESNWVWEWGDPPESWYDYPMFNSWPYPKHIRIVSNQKNLDDEGALQLEIDKWWPKERFTGLKGKYSYRSKINTDTGFSIEFLTYEMESAQHESKTCGLIVADEPIPSRLWGPTMSRFRQGGKFFITMTPLFGSAFLHEKIIQSADSGDRDIFYTYADVEDNCITHGKRGILTHQQIQKMVRQYPPEERESRTRGVFLSLRGRVHPAFKREDHVFNNRDLPDDLPSRDFILANPRLFQFYQVVDPHDRKYDAVGYYALDDNGRMYVIDEYPDRSKPPFHTLVTRENDYETLIKTVLIPKEAQALTLSKSEFTRIMDPRFAHHSSQRGVQKTGFTVEQEWTIAYGEGFETKIIDDLTACRNKLDARLRIANDGYPMIIFFAEYADNHIYALEHWMWDRWEGKVGEKRDIKEKPQEKNSDYCRMLHYLCMYDPVFVRKSDKAMGWRKRLAEKNKHKTLHPAGATWMGA